MPPPQLSPQAAAPETRPRPKEPGEVPRPPRETRETTRHENHPRKQNRRANAPAPPLAHARGGTALLIWRAVAGVCNRGRRDGESRRGVAGARTVGALPRARLGVMQKTLRGGGAFLRGGWSGVKACRLLYLAQAAGLGGGIDRETLRLPFYRETFEFTNTIAAWTTE